MPPSRRTRSPLWMCADRVLQTSVAMSIITIMTTFFAVVAANAADPSRVQGDSGTSEASQPANISPSPAPPPPAAQAPATPPPAQAPAAKSPVPAETPAMILNGQQVESILGKKVRSTAGDDMGRIIDIIADKAGQVRAAIVDFGGFLGVGNRQIAVDWKAIRFPSDGKTDAVIVDLSKDQLRVAPVYKPGEQIVVLGPQTAPPPAPPAAVPQPQPSAAIPQPPPPPTPQAATDAAAPVAKDPPLK